MEPSFALRYNSMRKFLFYCLVAELLIYLNFIYIYIKRMYLRSLWWVDEVVELLTLPPLLVKSEIMVRYEVIIQYGIHQHWKLQSFIYLGKLFSSKEWSFRSVAMICLIKFMMVVIFCWVRIILFFEIGLTKTLAKEFGSRGVCVNAVCPGKLNVLLLVSSIEILSISCRLYWIRYDKKYWNG